MKANSEKRRNSLAAIVVVFLTPVVIVALYSLAAKTYVAKTNPNIASSLASSVSD